MVLLAANAENNKERKSNRREAWEQPYPPVPTLALAYVHSLVALSLTLPAADALRLFFPSHVSRSHKLFPFCAHSLVCVRGLLCLFGWWGFSSSSLIVVAIWSRRQNYARRCHMVTLRLRLQCNTTNMPIRNRKSQIAVHLTSWHLPAK